MKATGIVRRLDDLGRVVIPKEIRRTLRLREGDPLEIFTNADGNVIFQKYAPLGVLSGFAAEYAEALSKTSGCTFLICDRERVVSSVNSRRSFADARISDALEQLLAERGVYVFASDAAPFYPLEGISRAALAVRPIFSAGDVVGAVILLGEASPTVPESTALTLSETSAAVLGRLLDA